jgi:hypothetical protein
VARPARRRVPGSIGRDERDPRQRAALHPFLQVSLGHPAIGAVASVEVVDEGGQYATALGRIGDHRRDRWQIRDHAVLEVERGLPGRRWRRRRWLAVPGQVCSLAGVMMIAAEKSAANCSGVANKAAMRSVYFAR